TDCQSTCLPLLLLSVLLYHYLFFLNPTATTQIYTLSLHDALPISVSAWPRSHSLAVKQTASARIRVGPRVHIDRARAKPRAWKRSEEHTSELQSPCNLVCRLLLEKKKKIRKLRKELKFKTTLADTTIS